MESSSDVTRILSRASHGDREALDQVLPLVYDELRSIAQRQLKHERRDHTLQPTALVHEAYARLIGQDPVSLQSRAHLLALAARAIRNILTDHARSSARLKRGGDRERVLLEDAPVDAGSPQIDVLALEEALEKLSKEDPDLERIVEMRFYAGMSEEDIATALGVSTRTVERRWRFARAWLHGTLSSGG